MSELGRGRVVVKESRGHFIPDLPTLVKNQVGASRGANSEQCDWAIVVKTNSHKQVSVSYTHFCCSENTGWNVKQPRPAHVESQQLCHLVGNVKNGIMP
jgi:hypothetical protein